MDDYIELELTIFDQPRQRVKVIQSLSVRVLIEEILKEFDDLDYLTVDSYALFLKGQESWLDPCKTITQLDLKPHDELEMGYSRLNRNIKKAEDRVILFSPSGGRIYEIRQFPALIGRSGNDQMMNTQLAVDLKLLPDSGHISRHHFQLFVQNKKFYIQTIPGSNPVFLNAVLAPVAGTQEVKHGDYIYLSQQHLPVLFLQFPSASIDWDMPVAVVALAYSDHTRESEEIAVISKPVFDLCENGFMPEKGKILYRVDTDQFIFDRSCQS